MPWPSHGPRQCGRVIVHVAAFIHPQVVQVVSRTATLGGVLVDLPHPNAPTINHRRVAAGVQVAGLLREDAAGDCLRLAEVENHLPKLA